MTAQDQQDRSQHGRHSMNPAQRAPGNMSGQQTDETDLDRSSADPGGPESSQPGNRSGSGGGRKA